MPDHEKNQFWIIFDTCTRPRYYQDLHNLLALPSGTLMRYEYRAEHISQDAQVAASTNEPRLTGILFFYAQLRDYSKGTADPSSPPNSSMIWIATRIGEMQSITRAGGSFLFNFKVLGYPANNQAEIMKLLSPKIEKNEAPFIKWVGLGDDIATYHQIVGGNDEAKWQTIVDLVSSAPNQFSGDSFWRLRGLFNGESKDPLPAKYKKQVGTSVSFYEVFEKETCLIDVATYNPSGGSQANRKLEIQNDKEGPFALVGEDYYDIRQHTSFNIELKAKGFEEIEERTGIIGFKTNPQTNDWPAGPRFSIRITARKKAWRTVASRLMLIFGGAALLFAPMIWATSKLYSVLVGLAGILFLVFKELMTSGKLPVKL